MKFLRFFIVLLIVVFIYACDEQTKEVKVSGNDDEVKKKELELKQKELELKEKELELKNKTETQTQPQSQAPPQQQQQQQAPPPQQQQQQAPPNIPPNQKKNNNYYGAYPGDYPEGSTRYLTYGDCAYKSKYQLKIMRNEIYARHGYIFQSSQQMWNHFNSQPWYNPRYYNVDNMLSQIERYNVNYIKSFE